MWGKGLLANSQFAWGKQCGRVLVCTREKKTMKLIAIPEMINRMVLLKESGGPRKMMKNDETWLALKSLRFRPSPPCEPTRDTARSAIHLKGIREEEAYRCLQHVNANPCNSEFQYCFNSALGMVGLSMNQVGTFICYVHLVSICQHDPSKGLGYLGIVIILSGGSGDELLLGLNAVQQRRKRCNGESLAQKTCGPTWMEKGSAAVFNGDIIASYDLKLAGQNKGFIEVIELSVAKPINVHVSFLWISDGIVELSLGKAIG